jgi:hypothetical protein
MDEMTPISRRTVIQPSAARRSSTSSTQSTESRGAIRALSHPSPPLPSVQVGVNRPTSLSQSGSRSAPLYETGNFPSLTRSDSLGARREWGEAPTYLEAMSSPPIVSLANSPRPPASLEAGVPPPRTPTLSARASTSFRDLIQRSLTSFRPTTFEPGDAQGSPSSSRSLLLQPRSSPLFTPSATSLITPTRDGGETPPTQHPSPWASTHSLVSATTTTPHTPRRISSPLPYSAVRVSFDTPPKAGLSADQVRFLGTSEAVHIAGVRLGQVPLEKRRDRGSRPEGNECASSLSIEQEGSPPPPWDDIPPESSSASASQSIRIIKAQNEGPAHTVDRPEASGANARTTDMPSSDTPSSPTLPPPSPTATSSATTPAVEVEPPRSVTALHDHTTQSHSIHPKSKSSVNGTDGAFK